MNKKKKLLTLEDLYSFFEENDKSVQFSSKESGYQLAVQVPAQFAINKEQNDDSLLFCLCKIAHTGINRNNSNLTEDAAKKMMKGIPYKPILANFCEVTDKDGNTVSDFTSHDMEIDDEGNFKYIEHQIGCFTADEPYMELDEETGNNYIYAYCAIPRDYTEACDIIERKNGTKVSIELAVNEASYSAKEHVLNLDDVVLTGMTCLGTNPETGEKVQEGMYGARLDIEDFSVENNSVKFDTNKMIEALEKLNTTLSAFNIGQNSVQKSCEKGGIVMDFEKTQVTDVQDENQETVIDQPEAMAQEEEVPAEDTSTQDADQDSTVVTEEAEQPKENKYALMLNGKVVSEFDLSLNDIDNALYDLVNQTYADQDNTWYWVQIYPDNNYVIMTDYWNNRAYKQTYSKDENDNFMLTGDRVEVYAEWLTADEKEQLSDMRANYSVLEQKVATYENAEVYADKMTIFDDEAYSDYLDTNEFKALMSKETVDKFSKEELQEKADATLGKLVKQNKSFSFAEHPRNKVIVPVATMKEKKNTYGNLFD